MNEIKCDICQKQFSETDLRNGHGIPHEIERLIVKDFPDWNDNKRICKDDLNIYRMKYISSLIEDEEGKIQELETSVIRITSYNVCYTKLLRLLHKRNGGDSRHS